MQIPIELYYFTSNFPIPVYLTQHTHIFNDFLLNPNTNRFQLFSFTGNKRKGKSERDLKGDLKIKTET